MRLSITLFLLSSFLCACSENNKKNNIQNKVVIETPDGWNLLDSLHKHKNVNISNGTSLLYGEETNYFETFIFNQKKYGITMAQGELKLYQLQNNQFELVHTFDVQGISLNLEQVDINNDNQLDLVIELISGGTYGSDFICLFYDNAHKKFIYNDTISLTNIHLNSDKNEVTSHTPIKKTIFKIKNYQLIKTTEIALLDGKRINSEFTEITYFDEVGNVLKKDTVLSINNDLLR